MSVPGDVDPKKVQPKRAIGMDVSPRLRMIDNPNFPNPTIETRKIAFLVADGFADAALLDMKQTLLTAGAVVPDGEASVASLKAQPDVANFLIEAYKHCKTIAASGAGVELLASTDILTAADEIPRTDKFEIRPGLLATREAYVPGLGDQFVTSIARHRHWEREPAS